MSLVRWFQKKLNQDKDGLLPIHRSARDGDLEAVKRHLANDPDVDVQSNTARAENNQTPLHYAASNGHKDVVAFLLEKKASLTGATKTPRKPMAKTTPLEVAAERGHTEVVKLLLEAKADIKSEDYIDFSPLEHAAYNNHRETVQALLEHIPDSVGGYRRLRSTDAQIIKSLLDKKADAHELLDHALLNQCSTETAKLILDSKMDLTRKSLLLLRAVNTGNFQIVKLLLEYKSNPNHRGDRYQIERSALARDPSILFLLFNHGREVSNETIRFIGKRHPQIAAEFQKAKAENRKIDLPASPKAAPLAPFPLNPPAQSSAVAPPSPTRKS